MLLSECEGVVDELQRHLLHDDVEEGNYYEASRVFAQAVIAVAYPVTACSSPSLRSSSCFNDLLSLPSGSTKLMHSLEYMIIAALERPLDDRMNDVAYAFDQFVSHALARVSRTRRQKHRREANNVNADAPATADDFRLMLEDENCNYEVRVAAKCLLSIIDGFDCD